jgi:hypothetical protein
MAGLGRIDSGTPAMAARRAAWSKADTPATSVSFTAVRFTRSPGTARSRQLRTVRQKAREERSVRPPSTQTSTMPEGDSMFERLPGAAIPGVLTTADTGWLLIGSYPVIGRLRGCPSSCDRACRPGVRMGCRRRRGVKVPRDGDRPLSVSARRCRDC